MNKRVDCVLLGVGGAWCVLSLSKGRSVPRRTPCAPLVGAVFEITKGTRVVAQSPNATRQRRVRDPETPRNSGWPTVSGQPLRCLNVSESGYGILGASWIEGISIEIGD